MSFLIVSLRTSFLAFPLQIPNNIFLWNVGNRANIEQFLYQHTPMFIQKGTNIMLPLESTLLFHGFLLAFVVVTYALKIFAFINL
jgi:hypothetical protein